MGLASVADQPSSSLPFRCEEIGVQRMHGRGTDERPVDIAVSFVVLPAFSVLGEPAVSDGSLIGGEFSRRFHNGYARMLSVRPNSESGAAAQPFDYVLQAFSKHSLQVISCSLRFPRNVACHAESHHVELFAHRRRIFLLGIGERQYREGV